MKIKNLVFLFFLLIVTAFFLKSTSANAASIAYDGDNVTNIPYAGSGGGTFTASHHATGSNLAAVLFLWHDTTVSNVTYGGQPMTLATSHIIHNPVEGFYDIWIYSGASSGTSTVSYTIAASGGGSGSGCQCGQQTGEIMTFNNAAQTGQPDAVGTFNHDASDNNNEGGMSITTASPNALVLGMFGGGGFNNSPSSNGTLEGTNDLSTAYNWISTTGVSSAGPFILKAKTTAIGVDYNVIGISLASAVSAPNAPQSLIATPSNNQVTLNWSAPSSGDPAASYDVYDKLTASSTYALYATTTGFSSIITSLTNGLSYDFAVYSRNSAGTSTLAATVSATPNPGSPNPPQSFTGSLTSTAGQVALSWSAPSSDGGSPLTSYEVYDKLTASSTYAFYASTIPATLNSTVTGLTTNLSYDFKVLARNAFGTSTISSIFTVIINNTATSTTGGGNWSSPSTWQGGVAPGDGYFVTVQGPVVIDQNIGSSGQGVKNIYLTGSSAGLSDNTSSPITILFASTGANSIGSGSFSSPGTDSTMFGINVNQGNLSLVGTQTNPITLKAANNTSPIYIAKVFNAPFVGANLTIKWADIYNVGSSTASSQSGINWSNSGGDSSNFVDIENSRFTSPYNVLVTDAFGADSAIDFLSNYITGGSAFASLELSGPFTHENIEDNTEVNPAVSGYFMQTNYAPTHLNLLRNAIEGTTSQFRSLLKGGPLHDGDTATGNTLQDNLDYDYPNAIDDGESDFGDSDDNTLDLGLPNGGVVDKNVGEGQWKSVQGGTTVTNNYLVSTISQSQGLLFVNGFATSTFSNNILQYFATPATNGVNPDVLDYNAGFSHTYDHNTIIGPSNDPGTLGCGSGFGNDGMQMGEANDPALDTTNDIIRSSLMTNLWNGIVTDTHTTYIQDFNGVGVHHNDVYNPGCATYVNLGSTNFDDGTHPHPDPRYGDVTADPQYYDPARISILNYDSRALSGPGTANDVFTKLGYRSGWGGTNTLGSNPIEDIRQWLFAGYAPTNAALKTAAADGTTIGAVPFKDAAAPSVSITNPGNGGTVAGIVTLTASSTDDVAVQGVQFQINRVNFGSQITSTSSPNIYTLSWNTASSTNGSYTVKAVSMDTSGNTATSTTITVTVNNGTIPSAPQSLTGTPADSQVSLSWSSPTSTGGSNLTAYFVEDKFSATSTWSSFATTSSTTLSSIVTGLSNGNSYDFRVSAINGIGTSSPSNTFTATPTAPAPSGGGGGGGGGGVVSPFAITNVSTVSSSSTSAAISWMTSYSANSEVDYGTTVNYGQVIQDPSFVTGHNLSLTNLSPNTTYYFQITGVSSYGSSITSSGYSFVSGSSIGTAIPSTPITPSSTPSQIPSGLPYPSSPAVSLINDNGTFYLIQNGTKQGVTSPGILNSYGLSFSDATNATPDQLNLPNGSLLLPADGSLVKGKANPTVYFISNGKRYGFVSADVFKALGFSFTSVLTVTDPELNALALSGNLANPNLSHPDGTDVLYQGTIYYISNQIRFPYPSLSVYNSWHIDNDFSNVVPANTADIALPVGEVVTSRTID